jgi:ABC-type transport system involved in multi-copper enzyme maturation permease subunit
MILDQEIPKFFDWFLQSLIVAFPVTIFCVAFFGWLIGFLISATRRGPVEGFYAVAKVIAGAVSDVVHFSLRRTIAMTMLAVRESLRRKVLIAFAVFVVVMLLAGWYLDVKSDQPARLYLSFVLTASNYLVLLLALFLSTFSLPNDFKNRTIHTIVTKPVRPLEIVLGRVLGFMFVGTVILAAMCLVSFFFVRSGLRHQHQFSVPEGQVASATKGQTTTDAHHHHTFELGTDGNGMTDVTAGHTHSVTKTADGIQVRPPSGMLQARVPKRGTLQFFDRSGKPGSGVNVGSEWMYRSYIEGGTLAAAVWTFENMTADRYPDGFELEKDIRVFRTHKGNIEKGIRGSIYLVNPNPAAKVKTSEEIPFVAREFVVDKQFIPRRLKAIEDGAVRDVDLFEALTHEGKLQVRILCSDPGQYFGMAPADVYVLDAEAPFWWNFVKGYIGIWLQMLLVTTFGVMFSTFLSGAVAMMATLSCIVIGFFPQFIVGVARGSIEGGGPTEALIRIVTQANLSTDLDLPNWGVNIIRALDFLFMQVMQVGANILPNYGDFNTAPWVAYGYNIEPALLGMHLLRGLAYFVVVSLVAYLLI